MRSFHPIAILTVVCFCIGLIRYGLQHTQNAGQGYSAQPPAQNATHEAYKARLEAQEAARKAAVARRAAYRRQRFRGW